MKTKDYSYSDPSIQFINQILSDIKSGDLLPPKFQRPFIWENQRKIELLNSIRDGIPIGSIMVWKTKEEEVLSYTNLGRFKLNQSSRNLRKQYILDGLQRLSTLFSALNEPDIDNLDYYDINEDYVYFYYDILKKEFFVQKQNFIPNQHQMPLNILMNSVKLLKFQRNIAKIFPDEEEVDSIVADIDDLASKFRNYKVPVISIATDDLYLVTETFRKINSQGKLINDNDMLHALTWSNNYDFNDSINALREEILDECDWGFISNDIILKTIKLNLNQNIYKTNALSLSKAIGGNGKIVKLCVSNIRKAILFLRDKLNIPSVLFLPYTLQLVAIANLFGYLNNNQIILNNDRIKILESWFWFTSYTEAYSGMSDNDFKKSIDDLTTSILQEEIIWSNLKVKYKIFNEIHLYNFRSVKSKRSILNLARLQDNFNFSGLNGELSATDILRKYGKLSIKNILNPNDILYTSDDDTIHKTFANKVIKIPNGNTNLIKDSTFVDGFNFSHISSFEFDPLLDGQDFLQERLDYLIKAESEFCNKTAGWFWENNILNI